MLEIILLIFLTRKVGGIIEGKGRKAGWYKAMTVALWIGGEIGGAIIGGIIVAISGAGQFLIYVAALLGAAGGAALAYVIANNVTPVAVEYGAPPPPLFG